MQDATGNWGGNLIFSTTSTGSSGQLTDRLTISSAGLATFSGGVTLNSTGSSLTAAGSTVLGTTSAQTLTVNATSTFTSTAAFTASTALTANGSVLLNGGSNQTLTVQATSAFSAPVTVNAAVNVSGLGTFSGGVALTTPVTVNGLPLAKVATTDNYTDLIGQPRFYAASSSYAATAGAPTQPLNVSTWYGSANISSGVATVHPTSNGLANGTALFLSILSVQATVYGPSVYCYICSLCSGYKHQHPDSHILGGDRYGNCDYTCRWHCFHSICNIWSGHVHNYWHIQFLSASMHYTVFH